MTTDYIELRETLDDTLNFIGQHATIHQGQANKHLSSKNEKFGETIHMDIGYVRSITIGGIKYCFYIVDRGIQQKYMYCLKNLDGDSIVTQFKQFYTDIGVTLNVL